MELNKRGVTENEGSPERRRKPRVAIESPATVRGVDANGQSFEENSMLDNLSAGGLFFQLPRQVEPGAREPVRVRHVPGGQHPVVRLRGPDVELVPDGGPEVLEVVDRPLPQGFVVGW